MATLAWPSNIPPPSGLEWGLQTRTQTAESPLSGAAQTIELPGARWRCTTTWEVLAGAEGDALSALLSRLRGPAGRVRLYHWARPRPAGSGATAGTVSIYSTGVWGARLSTTGWAPDAANVLLPGDYVSVGDHLYQVVGAVSANAYGSAMIDVEPPLRTQPPLNAPVTIVYPTGVFRLLDDEQHRLRWRAGRVCAATLDWVEAL